MTTKRAVLKSAVVLAALAGIAAPIAAYAADGSHYVAVLYGDDAAATSNSMNINNLDHDGNVKCYDISSLTRDGGAFTTTYKVYEGDEVKIDFYTSNDCNELTPSGTAYVYPSDRDRKYTYVTRIGKG